MTSSRERGEHYRPDVEGLRAVAVVLVLLYHAQIPGFGGGYVGVDVFFVISGFLITALLLRELDTTGRLSFTNFYARRVRRLLPASALTLIVVLGLSLLLLPVTRIPGVATDIASAAAYVSNLRFGAAANDYFQATAAPSPVLHFWSLSLEEQFYLFWPAVLVSLFTLSRRMHIGRTGVFIGMIAICAVSLAGCIWLTGQSQAWAFYLLPARAWELGTGALLAIVAARVREPRPRIAAALVLAGLAAIGVAAATFTDTMAFPGFAAVLPVAGAALVILGGFGRSTLPTRLLSKSPMTFLGQISYSVYLWHFPMLIFAGVLYGAALPLPVSLLVAAASIPVAAVTQRLVERPFRAGRFIGIRPRFNVGQAVASTLVVVLLSGGAIAYANGRVTGILDDLIPPLAELANARPTTGFCLLEDVANTQACVHGDPDSDHTILLFGDSHAWHWYPAFAQMAQQHDIRLVTLTFGACPSVNLAVVDSNLDPQCAAWRQKALDRIAVEHPDLVVISNFQRRPLMINGSEVSGQAAIAAAWLPALQGQIQQILGSAKAVAVIGDTPGGATPDCLTEHPNELELCSTQLTADDDAWTNERAAVEAAGALYVDPTPWLCNGRTCPAVIGRFIVYFDGFHLAAPFSAALEPQLEVALSRALPFEAIASAPPVAAASAPATACAPPDVTDSFTRQVHEGWATPDTGPAWISVQGDSAKDSVDGSVGHQAISQAPGGQFESSSVCATDVNLTARFEVEALPTGNPVSIHFWPRVVGKDAYEFWVAVTPAGGIGATIRTAIGSTGTTLGNVTLAPAGTYNAGDWWRARVEAIGSGPTVLRARVWRDGDPEPTTWDLDVTDSSPSLQTQSEAIEVGSFVGAGETRLPLRCSFDDISVSSTP